MYEIEKGIQMPVRIKDGQYPFSEMDVEDSFFVPALGVKRETLFAAIYRAAKKYKNRRFVTRSIYKQMKSSKEFEGVRVWRFE